MDEKAARMAEQLKSNPAMLQALMQSRDGQALMQMLTQGDRGAGLQRAVQSAAKGDPSEMVRLVNQVMQSPGGAELVQRINKAVQKYPRNEGLALMAEFDEKLNSLLSNPEAMAQIMQMAQSLSGGQAQQPPQQPLQQPVRPAPPPPPAQAPPPPGGDLLSTLSGLTGGIDPTMLTKLLPLIQELGSQNDSNARQLLYALRPYLKPERQEKIERALQLARLFHLGKKFLAGWEG